jgi:8-oxo-dGTP diphosphatase
MQSFASGFLFNEDVTHVALVLKNKPAYLAGRWNAIGGKMEERELSVHAMRREFQEEAGLEIAAWNKFALLSGGWGEIHCFWSKCDLVHQARSEEEETVQVWPLNALPDNLDPDAAFLLTMAVAMAKGVSRADLYTIYRREK